jgi:hypothetical protein
MAGMLRVTRLSHVLDGFRRWEIALDGSVVGCVANGKAAEVLVERGDHTLRLGHRWWGSALIPFTVKDLETTEFVCRPRPHLMTWIPYGIASLYRHDLFIMLGQVSVGDLRRSAPATEPVEGRERHGQPQTGVAAG